eukprot:Amastigsp_a184505_13.p3 type:complete len:138 gc:universal Amastigsp_a184505_13:177-590(+)
MHDGITTRLTIARDRGVGRSVRCRGVRCRGVRYRERLDGCLAGVRLRPRLEVRVLAAKPLAAPSNKNSNERRQEDDTDHATSDRADGDATLFGRRRSGGCDNVTLTIAALKSCVDDVLLQQTAAPRRLAQRHHQSGR